MSDDTPRLGHAPIGMCHVPPEVGQLQERGDFYWDTRGGKRTLVLAPPCQRHGKDDGKQWVYSRWTIDHPNHCDAQWSWDGNEDAPTLDPSLHAVGIWHGWVKGGRLEEA